ncbi:PilC/PilY family type IV pilus protein, partial [Aquisalimonas sp.]|uniref:pilus assembly protein n=1 Tax=Aquisalimonas sp. TaxID=1872621 RepID=UPI0025BB526E
MPVLLGALILAPHAAAEVVVDPDTQPPATLAPYALKSTNLEAGATRAYRPWFENGTWMGDLVEYTISQQGERTTDVPVGAYPPEQGEENWSARAGFPEHERDLDGDGEALEEPDDVFWKERNLFTVKECSANPCNTVPFWWDRLSDHQKSSLDPVAFADEDAQDGPEAKASELLNFVRGDRSHERDQEGGRLRLRFSVLGDIINSRPVYLPAGSHGLALVGSNGGMLHGFNAETGKEVFGYVPSMLLGKLDRLARVPYRHTYFVDGELRGRSFDDRHVVAGGLGAGARGLFTLDVSDPTDPDVLFELSGSDNEDIGHIHGRPGIARLPDDKWYVIFGNGYLSDSDRAKLILMPVSGGSPITITTNYAGNNGLSAPALVDLDGNGRVDYAYAGDLRGNVWRFDLDAQTRTRLFTDSRGNPITVEPDVARHPTGSGVMVYVGTGSLLSAADLDVTSEQSVYGLWDRLDDSSPIDSARLIQQELVEVTRDWDGNERTVRVIGTTDDDGELVDIEPNWHGEGHDLGWMVPLPSEGERLLGHPQIRGGRLQFTSLNPSQRDADDVRYNESWIIQLGLASGGSPQRALFDLNRDERLDEEDGLAMAPPGGEAQHKYPVALRLGRGNIAQPAFARVVQYIDAVFINGLLLPESIDDTGESLVFGGDIDVTTDSPHGPLVNPHEQDPDYPDDGRKTDTDPDARGPMNKHLAADGLGNRLDGHHRAYDKVHNVRYIDYFDLEPRRGLRSLLPTGEPYDVLPELNRVTEVNGLADDQKFIVVLTNADLSKGTELQIGCRAWPSYEYQEMITPQLRDGTSPRDLRDQNGRSLIFTLEDIENDKGGVCDSEEREPTLRITVTDRVGKDGVLQGTLPGCVND